MSALLPDGARASVRMYHPGGLGDCFLLGFPKADGEVCYVLIDCGVFFATAGDAERMRAIAEDVAATTGGRLDILVATHEHWDHLSGFTYARKTFDAITIDQVWLAWTEDPEDETAERLREHRLALARGLYLAADRMAATSSGKLQATAERIRDVLAFHGDLSASWDEPVESGPDDPADDAAGNPLPLASTANQLAYVRGRVEKPCYLRPGSVQTLPGVPGVRAYVLGPPTDETLLRRSRPSRRRTEVYGELAEDDTSFAAAALDLQARAASGRASASRADRPFGDHYAIELESAAKDPEFGGFFEASYRPPRDSTLDKDIGYRRIDHDWLWATGDLALKLDEDTNNTSLVLAFELEPDRRVLLFPGDAQVGNCQSWKTVAFSHNGTDSITGEDLLQRTVLYKVGHHGSHNATLRQDGLELMATAPDVAGELVALIPVDQKQARDKSWRMPFEPLLDRLLAKTRGRILRTDAGFPTTRPEALCKEDWGVFRRRISADPSDARLWLQYVLSDSVPPENEAEESDLASRKDPQREAGADDHDGTNRDDESDRR